MSLRKNRICVFVLLVGVRRWGFAIRNYLDLLYPRNHPFHQQNHETPIVKTWNAKLFDLIANTQQSTQEYRCERVKLFLEYQYENTGGVVCGCGILYLLVCGGGGGSTSGSCCHCYWKIREEAADWYGDEIFLRYYCKGESLDSILESPWCLRVVVHLSSCFVVRCLDTLVLFVIWNGF